MFRTFVDADVVIQQVYKRLRSYHEAGLIDPGLFGQCLRKGLEDVGIDPGEDDLEALLSVKGGKARLPTGCVTVLEVWLQTEPYTNLPVDSLGWIRTTRQVATPAEIQLYPFSFGAYNGHKHYKQSGPWLLVNEQQGLLRVVYTGSLGETELPPVPAEPIIQDFLVKKLIYEQLHDWYLNADVAGLERLLQLTQAELADAQALAAKYEKLPTFDTLVKARNNRPKPFTWNRS